MTALDEAFRSAYGRPSAGIWSAPGRVNLIGEHTDYNDGFVLPLALPLRTAVAADVRPDRVLAVRSLQRPDEPLQVGLDELAPGSADGWGRYAAGVLWALERAGHRVGGADLLVDGRVPSGGGLSSSAALECAVAVAVNALYGLGLAPAELARVAQQAEGDFVGVPVGPMDQMASMLCTQGHALFLDTRTLVPEQVPLDLADAGLRLLVIDTRVTHDLSEGAYADRRATCEAAAARLGVVALRDVDEAGLEAALARLDDPVQRRRVRHVVSENARVLAVVDLLHAGLIGDPEAPGQLGGLLTASHVSLRDDYEVSAPELDAAVDAALAAGALGARMTGGGFGGCAIALVGEAAEDAVTGAVADAFAKQGWAAPAVFTALPSAGAGPGA